MPLAVENASARLAQELTKKVRDRGLVLWVDAERQYAAFVDALSRKDFGFEYPVIAFRGSYLELMLALEPFGNGLYPEKALVHLSGLNKETVKETPVYELYKAGTVFEKGLTTLVREAAVGSATPEEIDAFVRSPGLTLAGADEWLASLRAAPRDRLTLLLESVGRDHVVMELLGSSKRFDDELPAAGEQLLTFLSKEIGLTAAFRKYRIDDGELRADTVARLVASYLMAVEYVHDLREAAIAPELEALRKIGPVAAECRRLVQKLRDQRPADYESWANEFQEQLAVERQQHGAQALGSIDTFRFEEAAVREAVIEALRESRWADAEELCTTRTPEDCFWVKHSNALARTWELLRRAAVTGKALLATKQQLKGCGSLNEAVERYVKALAPVDRLQREFEQRAHALLLSDLEDYDALLEVRASLQRAYRDWADATNRAFFELCTTYGALPERGLRQRAVYDDVVTPQLAGGERVAFVMVDALRFEMAQALAEELKRDKYVVTLQARLAELPTITAVGMNALAPAQVQGRLQLVGRDGEIKCLSTQEFRISDPETRLKAMTARVGAPVEGIALEDFQGMRLEKLKKRLNNKARLVMVHSQELDTAGENKLHLATFDNTLSLLKSALSLLRQAGVERFVIASDHGFLLQDAATESVPLGANMRVADRRHALLPSPSGAADVLEVKLSALEYDVEQDQYLVLRADTAVWKTKNKMPPFVHGGNSLQERVIPVLVLERHGARGKTTSRYEVVARAEPAHLGRQRLKIAVRLQRQATGEMSFASPKTISLTLRVVERRDLTVTVLNADPPAQLVNGQLVLVPEKDEALVEFEVTGGEVDEKVRVEVFHAEALEEVTPKIVEGFFDVGRDRRLGKLKGDSVPPTTASASTAPPGSGVAGWAELIQDEQYRRALVILEQRRSINEAELAQVLGSPRRVRAFSRAFDDLLRFLPFEVEIRTVQGMKAYTRKD
jgi:hypothetical protein